MASFNKALLLGHLGHDPEVRYTPKGTPVVNLRMATTKRWTDRESDEKRERTEWHRVVVFGKQAEFLTENVKKGAQIHVEGSLQTREWTDRDGNKRYTTEVLARQVLLLGKRETPDDIEPPAAVEPPADQEPEESEDIPF